MIFSHVSFQGVVEGVLERAGVVGVVQPASTSDPASKQPSCSCNKLQLPLKDTWKVGKLGRWAKVWDVRSWERANSREIGRTQVPLGGAGGNKRVHCQTRPLPPMIREVVRASAVICRRMLLISFVHTILLFGEIKETQRIFNIKFSVNRYFHFVGLPGEARES